MKKLDENKLIEQLKKVHNNTYVYISDTYNGAHSKMKMICHKHGEFWQKPYGIEKN